MLRFRIKIFKNISREEKMKRWLLFLCLNLIVVPLTAQLFSRSELMMPELKNFRPLPKPDPAFSKVIARFVKESGLDEMTVADKNPDGEDEWSSVCVVDLSDPDHPVVGGWNEQNFVYPASSYKLYVLGEAIRQNLAGEYSLDDIRTVKKHNVRGDSRLEADQKASISEILRLMMMYSDNTAANEAIDLVDRRRASALLRSMGCEGSDITRKYLSRTLEDDGYSTVPGTTSCALHFATFLWAVESGAVGGGKGRGLIKGYMGTNETAKNRFRAGLPESATLYCKTGTWDTFTSEVAIVEEGKAHYIVCVLTALPSEKADGRMASFIRMLHNHLKK
jgi:beta-lactamase class A